MPRRGLVWTQRLQVALGYDDEIRRIPVSLNAARVDVAAARGLPAPLFVLPTGGGVGYGGFVLDTAQPRATCSRHLPDIPDALTRGGAIVTLWEEMLDGRAPRRRRRSSMLVAALPRERDELNVQRMLSYTQQGYWKFLLAAARDALTPRLERILRDGLDAAPTPSLKSAWFSALRDTALTPGDAAVARADLAEDGDGAGARARGAGLHRARAGAGGPRRAGVAGDSRPAARTDAEPGSQGAVRLRQARAVCRPARPRRVLREPGRRAAPPARAVGARRRLPTSTTRCERRRRGSTSPAASRCCARFSGPATSFFRSDGWTRRSRATAPRAPRRWSGRFLAALPPDYPDRLRRIILSSADDLFRAAR